MSSAAAATSAAPDGAVKVSVRFRDETAWLYPARARGAARGQGPELLVLSRMATRGAISDTSWSAGERAVMEACLVPSTVYSDRVEPLLDEQKVHHDYEKKLGRGACRGARRWFADPKCRRGRCGVAH